MKNNENEKKNRYKKKKENKKILIRTQRDSPIPTTRPFERTQTQTQTPQKPHLELMTTSLLPPPFPPGQASPNKPTQGIPSADILSST